VEQADVGLLCLDHPYGRLDVLGLADDFDGPAQLRAHAAAEHPVVVHEHDAYDARRRAELSGSFGLAR